MNALRLAGLSLISAGLMACSSMQVIYVPSDLKITEVAGKLDPYGTVWVEVTNPTSKPIALQNYQLRTQGASIINPAQAQPTPVLFALPSLTLAPGGRLMIGANADNTNINSAQQIFLRQGEMIPTWDKNGFVELVKSNATVDFVAFGNTTATPLTPEHWKGNPLPALVTGVDSYNRGAARKEGMDGNTAADWFAVNFLTPGGPNDVPSNATDADQDGIPDSAEVAGGTYAGLNLYLMGARSNQRDLFIEVDWMESTDAGVIPQKEALDKVKAVFAARGIQVHFDAGNLFSPVFASANHNLGGGNMVPFQKCVGIPFYYKVSTCEGDLHQIKSQNSDLRRRTIFHYMVFGNSQKADGTGGSSGIAELPGNDLLVTLGNWGLNRNDALQTNLLINFQAGTIMHELGHNLNLRHGGENHNNYKPNFYSVMNYYYQLNGLPDVAAPNTADRFNMMNGLIPYQICQLHNSPCSTSYKMDYSDGTGGVLNEAALDEHGGIGRGKADIDFNLNKTIDNGLVSANLSTEYDEFGNAQNLLLELRDHNDWANVLLDFARTDGGNNQGLPHQDRPVMDYITQDRQPVSQEEAPSEAFFQSLKNAR